MRRSRQFHTVSLVLFLALALPGCSDDAPAPLTADSPVFSGLPRDVAVEVLANPSKLEGINLSPSDRDSVAQTTVRDFLMCRDMYRVYRGWVTTGQAPEPRPLAVPAKPLEPGNTSMVTEYAEFVGVVKSGEPKQLKEMMTATGGCGTDIPLKPGDLSGPTIADAVKSL